MNTIALQPRRQAVSAGQPTFWQRVWAGLEAHGRRRAEAELRRIATLHFSTDPELSRQLRVLAHRTASR